MILITAFQPFGPKGRLLGTNASLEVLRRVDATRPGRYVTDVLAVGEEGLAAYRRLLSERAWTGLLPMGESGMIRSDHVVLEPLANIVERPGFVWPGRAAGTEPSISLPRRRRRSAVARR
jgi:hypothetical protein